MQTMTAILKPVVEDADQEETDRINSAGEAYNNFILFFSDNLILIPQQTVDQLNTIKDDYWNSLNDYTFGRNYGIKDKFTFEKSLEAGERVREEIQPALNQLIRDFRD